MELEIRASCLLGKGVYHLSHCASPILMFFEALFRIAKRVDGCQNVRGGANGEMLFKVYKFTYLQGNVIMKLPV
jgi:hypothetical protein